MTACSTNHDVNPNFLRLSLSLVALPREEELVIVGWDRKEEERKNKLIKKAS